MMTVEGVSFNERLVRMMPRDEFLITFGRVFFQDRCKADREKLLGAVYDRITAA